MKPGGCYIRPMTDEDRRHKDWFATVLQSIGGTIAAILLVWIASNQVTIITSQAVLQRDFVAQSDALKTFTRNANFTHDEVKEWFTQVWPRLRAHGENVELLRNEVEDVCSCSIDLKTPDDF